MRNIRLEPILTDTYESVDEFRPVPGSAYIYGVTAEDRSTHTAHWRAECQDVNFVEIHSEAFAEFQVVGDLDKYFLRGTTSLNKLLNSLGSGRVLYIDITGLTHPTWAALIRTAVDVYKEIRIVYVEPSRYRRSEAPLQGQVYDLSSRIAGITPMPGFATISENDDSVFVPMLGFEGARLRHALEHVQPDRVIPIVGHPGFKPWYVFETYSGNRSALEETKAWQEVVYAAGNCPFNCFYVLQKIAGSNPLRVLKVAMIGTKPHALAAVMFSLISPERIELIYDNPIRKAGRTDGSDRLLVYHVSAILSGINKNSSVKS
ncbi:hypothetical protein HD842_004027 [Massilia aurea]|uniref:Uncharacterized protein n=1 Tax=Massilia aurea TaxID=373040 RepID=A0A7X0CG18_9BURK|nr:hypothetical protein [Massilia aurea]MBB6135850.1 hypothetical protein [Massilia aurea]